MIHCGVFIRYLSIVSAFEILFIALFRKLALHLVFRMYSVCDYYFQNVQTRKLANTAHFMFLGCSLG